MGYLKVLRSAVRFTATKRGERLQEAQSERGSFGFNAIKARQLSNKQQRPPLSASPLRASYCFRLQTLKFKAKSKKVVVRSGSPATSCWPIFAQGTNVFHVGGRPRTETSATICVEGDFLPPRLCRPWTGATWSLRDEGCISTCVSKPACIRHIWPLRERELCFVINTSVTVRTTVSLRFGFA